jgi:hypothetical protein
MSRTRQIWNYLTRPWLAAMLQQVTLCRASVSVVLVLGVAHLLGYSLLPCLFARITGLPCPGCGMTRAVAALLHGEWRLGLAYHPFAPAFVMFGLLVALCAMAPVPLRGRVVQLVKAAEDATRFATIFLFAAVIYGLLRMGGLCSNHASVERSLVSAWIQARQGGG